MKHYPDRVSEDDYLRVVHEPSEPHLIGHYLPSPQTEFAEVRRLLHIMRHELGLHLFVFRCVGGGMLHAYANRTHVMLK